MSDNSKFKYIKAFVLAEALQNLLSSFCEKIEIAGSLRRKKDEVSDIELLFIPKMDTRGKQGDMFATESVSLAAEFIEKLLLDGEIEKRLSEDRKPTWGPKNKLAIHKKTGVPVDFFSTTPENWWVSLVIRTGSKETNLKLTTGAQARGCTLNAYGAGITLPNGNVVAATSERHVFELCGVPYLEPEKR